MKLVDRRVFIDASPARVDELLTDAELLVEWMAPTAQLDPTPGGIVTWTHVNGDSVFGEFVELTPHRRIVFTYGWDREDVGSHPDRQPSRSTYDLAMAELSYTSCTAVSPNPWQTRTPADGPTTSPASRRSRRIETRVRIHSPASVFRQRRRWD